MAVNGVHNERQTDIKSSSKILTDFRIDFTEFDSNDNNDHQHHSTHWGRETHISVGKLTIIVSDNGLSPGLLSEPMLEYF